MNEEQLTEARGWISDCTWAGAPVEPEDIDELTDAQVARVITRHYGGGVAQFVADVS